MALILKLRCDVCNDEKEVSEEAKRQLDKMASEGKVLTLYLCEGCKTLAQQRVRWLNMN